jgi:hypothetical protein
MECSKIVAIASGARYSAAFSRGMKILHLWGEVRQDGTSEYHHTYVPAEQSLEQLPVYCISLEYPRDEVLAFVMGAHHRLGKDSMVYRLSCVGHVLQMITRECGPIHYTPHNILS